MSKGGIIMLNILICEDNQQHLEYIQELTYKNMKNSRIHTFNSGEKLHNFFTKNPHLADIIICDIKLGHTNGIKIIQTLKNINPQVQIIFISAHIKYCQDVYSVDHVYFLAKPVNEEKFRTALHKAKEKSLKQRNEYITITTRGTITLINLNDIYYLETILRQLKIYTPTVIHTQYAKLTEFIKQLDQRFLICHQSYAVNMDKIIGLEKNKFILNNQLIIPISRSKFNYAKTTFINYLGETNE